ncbi:uncharacterized protein [Physcomitrium patens]|uniref:uncharacterized protein n=1 Tax=Physcomitrium patens TaxID=3218 RepID=UPI000D15C4BC|nr:uncharacterized protein LOC112295142 [Physcomitrium patens]|eukprot:XP_024402129.1 uncharacterized protein LOC112295142 [Physcomitrella patens]
MVLIHDTKPNKSWCYQTTSGQYGAFYSSITPEDRKEKELHYECDRRAAQLSEELKEAKACLEMVNLGGVKANQGIHGRRGPCCFEACAKGIPCESPSAQHPGFLNSSQAWDCGKKLQPEYLEDHIRSHHPRLAHQFSLTPKTTFGSADTIGRPVHSSGGNSSIVKGGEFAPARPQICPPAPRSCIKQENNCSPSHAATQANVLPPTSRYGFYRYFGCAGQGAKTSKGCCPGC